MRILIVTQYFWPENVRINDLTAELVSRGHDVSVLTGWPNYPAGRIFEDYRSDPGRFGTFQGASIVRVPLVPRGSGSLRLAINYISFVVSGLTVGVWKLRRKKFDVVLSVMLSPATAAIPAVAQRRLKGIPHLSWVLDLWPESLSAVGAIKSKFLLNQIGKLIGLIYRNTDRVLVQSRAFVENVKRYGGESVNIEYFPAWAESIFEGDISEVAPAAEMARYSDTFNILFAGNVGEAQDFPAILDAADKLRDRSDIRWIIVGDGRKLAWVESEVVARKLTDRVVILGRHPIDRMPSFFAPADALLVSLRPDPIFAATIPGKLQAYLASGIPVLGMLDGEGARVIRESQAGFVVASGDSGGLAAAVERLAALGREERAAMGHRGRSYCEREFNRSVLVSTLESWMKAQAGKAGRSPCHVREIQAP